MIEGSQGNDGRPEESGRFVILIQITKPDGSTRVVECTAEIGAAELSLDPPAQTTEA